MTVKQQAAIFGTVVAIIVCGGGAYLLHSNADRLGLLGLVAICVPGMAFCLLLAWRLDKRASDRQEREQSDPS